MRAIKFITVVAVSLTENMGISQTLNCIASGKWRAGEVKGQGGSSDTSPRYSVRQPSLGLRRAYHSQIDGDADNQIQIEDASDQEVRLIDRSDMRKQG